MNKRNDKTAIRCFLEKPERSVANGPAPVAAIRALPGENEHYETDGLPNACCST